MNVEEKAKAYDEALEIARQIHNGNPSSGTAIVVCEQIFPQLRESEDERVRKRAIAILKQQRDYWSYDGPMNKFPPATPRKDLVDAIDVALAYLEKQKESLHISETCKENADSFTQEIPMPDSTTLLKMWEEVKAMLTEKKHENERKWGTWRIAYNAFLEGFGKGYMVKQKKKKPNIEICPHSTKSKSYSMQEKKPADDTTFEKWLDDWYQGSKEISGYVVMSEAEFKNWSRGIKNMYQQKLDIALIQRSWYMEGYHDREFGQEPMWLVTTGEGGQKYKLNPKYGQSLAETQNPAWSEEDVKRLYSIGTQIGFLKGKYSEYQKDIDWLHALAEKMGFHKCKTGEIVTEWKKEDIDDKMLSKPKQEWSEEDNKMRLEAIRVLESGCERYRKESGCLPGWHKVINWLKSLRPLPKSSWSEEDEKMLNEVLDRVAYAFYDQGNEGEIEDDPAFLWLHRLRPSWKPSEAQMDALAYAIQILDDGLSPKAAKAGEELEHLREQLKKL